MEKKSFKNGTKKVTTDAKMWTKNNAKKREEKVPKPTHRKTARKNMLTQKCDKIVSEKREKSSRIFKLNKRKKVGS